MIEVIETGSARVDRLFGRISSHIPEITATALDAAFELVTEEARKRAPRLTGTLAEKGLDQETVSNLAQGTVRAMVIFAPNVINPLTKTPVAVYGRIQELKDGGYIRPALADKLTEVTHKFEAGLSAAIAAEVRS